MRALLPLLFFFVTLGLFFPASAAAAETETAPDTFREWAHEKAQRENAQPKSPVEQPADWIAVGGIICYAIIPVVLVVGLGVIAYRVYVHNTESALLVTSRDAWIYRGASARPPPGLVLLSF